MGNAAVFAGSKPQPPSIIGSPAAVDPSNDVHQQAVTEALNRLRDDGSHQFAFSAAPLPPDPPPEWLRSLSDFLASLLNGAEPLFTALFWIAVAALIGFLLYMLVPAVRDWVDMVLHRRRQSDDEQHSSEDWLPDAGTARDLLAEADALAAAGRYGDAVHLLLGRSLEDIDRRRPGLLKPAMTSRIIATEPALPPPARSAFSELAATVERALFALREISAEEWQAARAAYGRFTLRDQWAGARS
jgi:hypothetical protein